MAVYLFNQNNKEMEKPGERNYNEEISVSLVLMLSGKGERFGENKLLVPFKGVPLYQIALKLARESGADHVRVVTAYKEIADYVKERCPDYSIVINDRPQRGISESIKRGLLYEPGGFGQGVDGCCFLTGDMPLLRASSLKKLIACFRDHPEDICMLAFGKRKGIPAVFPARFFAELSLLEGDQGGKAVALKHPDAIRTVMVTDPWELSDIDTPQDLERLIN